MRAILEPVSSGFCIIVFILRAVCRTFKKTFFHIWRGITTVKMPCNPFKCFKRRSDVCQNCKKSEACLKDVISQHEQQAREYTELKTRYSTLEQEYTNMTKQMAVQLEKRGTLENINDENSNVQLGLRFKNLYNHEWRKISSFLKTNEKMKDIPELERIGIITKLMKKANTICVDKANRDLRSFLSLEDEDEIPTTKKFPELYNIRKRFGQNDQAKKRLSEKIAKSVLAEETLESDVKGELEMFLKKFSECCWLMTISQPRLFLNFDVYERSYGEEEMEEKFSHFSAETNVYNENFKPGTIIEIVWPCVENETREFHTKGMVITVAKRRNNSPSMTGTDKYETEIK